MEAHARQSGDVYVTREGLDDLLRRTVVEGWRFRIAAGVESVGAWGPDRLCSPIVWEASHMDERKEP